MIRVDSLHAPRLVLILAITAFLVFGAAAAAVAGETRVSVTTQGLKSVIDKGQGSSSHDEFTPGASEGRRSGSLKDATGATAQSKGTSNAQLTANTDFWFYSADVELFADKDRDGYFAGIDLLFDADTIYAAADVYAVVYLSLEGGVWEEYAVTEDFTLFGASSEDEYVIVTDLVAGYPTGSYDVLIELFDALDGAFVADFGPADTSELAYLPLEDAERDAPAPGGSTIVVSQGGGGAFGWTLLLALAALVSRRRQV